MSSSSVESKNANKMSHTESVKSMLAKMPQDVPGNSIPKIQSKRLQEKAKVLNKGRITLDDLLKNISERNEKFGFLSSTLTSPKSCGTRENKSLSPKYVQPCGSQGSKTLSQRHAKRCTSQQMLSSKSSMLLRSQENKSFSPKCVQPCESQGSDTMPQKHAKPCVAQEDKSLSNECVKSCESLESDTVPQEHAKPCASHEDKSLSTECMQSSESPGGDTLAQKHAKPCASQEDKSLSTECVKSCVSLGSDTSAHKHAKPCISQEDESLSTECVKSCESLGSDTSAHKHAKPCVSHEDKSLSTECMKSSESPGGDTLAQKHAKPCVSHEDKSLSTECVKSCESPGSDTLAQKHAKPCISQEDKSLSSECMKSCESQGSDTLTQKHAKPCASQEDKSLSPECMKSCESQGSDTLTQKHAKPCASQEDKSLSPECMKSCESQGSDTLTQKHAKPCASQEDKSLSPECMKSCESQGSDTLTQKHAKPCASQEKMLPPKDAILCASQENRSLSPKCVQPGGSQEIDSACTRYTKPYNSYEKESFPTGCPQSLLPQDTQSIFPQDAPIQAEEISPKIYASCDTVSLLDNTLDTSEKMEKIFKPIQKLIITPETGLEESKVLEKKSDQITEKVPINVEVEKVKNTQEPVLEIDKSHHEASNTSYSKNDEQIHISVLQHSTKCSITSQAEMNPVVLLEKLPSWINQYQKIKVLHKNLQPLMSEEKGKRQKEVLNMASSIIFLADKSERPKRFRGNTSFGKQQGYKLLSKLSKKNRHIIFKRKKQLILPNKRLTRSQKEEIMVDFNAKLPDDRQVKPRMFKDDKGLSFHGFNVPFGLLRLPDHYLVYKNIFDSYRDEGYCINEVMGTGCLDMKSKTVYLTGEENFFKSGLAISKDLTEEITPTISVDINEKCDAFASHHNQLDESIGHNNCSINDSPKAVAEMDNSSDSQAACKPFLSTSQNPPSESNSRCLDEVNSVSTGLNCSNTSYKSTSENKTVLTHELIKKLDESQSNTGKSDLLEENGRNCLKDFCRLGCICESLEVRERTEEHCGHEGCMFSTFCCMGSNVPATASDPSKLLLLNKSNTSSPDEEIVRSKRKRKAPKRLFEEDMIFDMNFSPKKLNLSAYSLPIKKKNHERITDCCILLTKFHLSGADVRCLNHLRINCFCLRVGKTRNVAVKSTSCNNFKRPPLNVALKSTSQRLLVSSKGTLYVNTPQEQPPIKQYQNPKNSSDTKKYVPKKILSKTHFSDLKEFQETLASEEIKCRDLEMMCNDSLDELPFNTIIIVKLSILDDLLRKEMAFMWLRHRLNQRAQVFITKMLSPPDFACICIQNLDDMSNLPHCIGKIFNEARNDPSSLTCCILTSHGSFWEVKGSMNWVKKSSDDMLMTSNSLNSFGDYSLLTHSSKKNVLKKLLPAKEGTIDHANISKDYNHQNPDISLLPIPMTSSSIHLNLSDETKSANPNCHSSAIKPGFHSVSDENAQSSSTTILKNNPKCTSNHENFVWYRLDLNGEFDELSIEETSFWVTHAQLESALKISQEKNRVVRVSFDAMAKSHRDTWRQNIYIDPNIDNFSVRVGPYFPNEHTRIKTFKNMGGILEPTVPLLKMMEYQMRSNDFLNVQAVEHIYKDINLDVDIEITTPKSSSLKEVMKCSYPDPNNEDNISPEDEEPGFAIKIADVQGNWAGFNEISSTCSSLDKTYSLQMAEDSTEVMKFSSLSYISEQPLSSDSEPTGLNKKCIEGKDIVVANMHPVKNEMKNLLPVYSKNFPIKLTSELIKEPPKVPHKASATFNLNENCIEEISMVRANMHPEKVEVRNLFPVKSKDLQKLTSWLKKDSPKVPLKTPATASLNENCTKGRRIIPLGKGEMTKILLGKSKELKSKLTSVLKKCPPKVLHKKSATAGGKNMLRANINPGKTHMRKNPFDPNDLQIELASVLRKDLHEIPLKDSAAASLNKNCIERKALIMYNEFLEKGEMKTVDVPGRSKELQSKVTSVPKKKETKIPVEASANADINGNGFEGKDALTDNRQSEKDDIETNLFLVEAKNVKIEEASLPKQEPHKVSEEELAECINNNGNIVLGYLVPDIPGIHPIPVARGGMTELESKAITMKDPILQDGDNLHFLDLGSANVFLNQAILKVVNFFPKDMIITWAFVKVDGKDSKGKFDGLMELKEMSKDMFITPRGVFYYDQFPRNDLQRAGINKTIAHRFMEAKRRRAIYYAKRELEELIELKKSAPMIRVIAGAMKKISILEKENELLDVQRTTEIIKKTRLLTHLRMLCTDAQYQATLKKLQDIRRTESVSPSEVPATLNSILQGKSVSEEEIIDEEVDVEEISSSACEMPFRKTISTELLISNTGTGEIAEEHSHLSRSDALGMNFPGISASPDLPFNKLSHPILSQKASEVTNAISVTSSASTNVDSSHDNEPIVEQCKENDIIHNICAQETSARPIFSAAKVVCPPNYPAKPHVPNVKITARSIKGANQFKSVSEMAGIPSYSVAVNMNGYTDALRYLRVSSGDQNVEEAEVAQKKSNSASISSEIQEETSSQSNRSNLIKDICSTSMVEEGL